MEEEKIITLTCKYDYEAMKKFNKMHMYTNTRNKIVTLVAIALFIFSIFSQSQDIEFRVWSGLIAIIWFLEMIFLPIYSAKKAYKTSKLYSSTEIIYDFFKDHIILKTIRDGEESGESRIKYTDLYKVIDTKEYVYMYVTSNQGYICSKKNINLEEYSKLSEVFKDNLAKKYRIKR